MFFYTIANSQTYQLDIQTGAGFYNMDMLKEMNSAITKQLEFPSKLVEDFPATVYLRPSISRSDEYSTLGAALSYMSSGSRISSRDYSGEYAFDMIATAITPSLQYDWHLLSNAKYRCSFRSNIGLTTTKLKIIEKLRLFESETSADELRFSSTNLSYEPGLNFAINFNDFALNLYSGYLLIVTQRPLTLSDNHDAEFRSFNDDPVIANWNGFRIGFSLSYLVSVEQLMQ